MPSWQPHHAAVTTDKDPPHKWPRPHTHPMQHQDWLYAGANQKLLNRPISFDYIRLDQPCDGDLWMSVQKPRSARTLQIFTSSSDHITSIHMQLLTVYIHKYNSSPYRPPTQWLTLHASHCSHIHSEAHSITLDDRSPTTLSSHQ